MSKLGWLFQTALVQIKSSKDLVQICAKEVLSKYQVIGERNMKYRTFVLETLTDNLESRALLELSSFQGIFPSTVCHVSFHFMFSAVFICPSKKHSLKSCLAFLLLFPSRHAHCMGLCYKVSCMWENTLQIIHSSMYMRASFPANTIYLSKLLLM